MTAIPLTVDALCPSHGPVVQASLTELLRSYQYVPVPPLEPRTPAPPVGQICSGHHAVVLSAAASVLYMRRSTFHPGHDIFCDFM